MSLITRLSDAPSKWPEYLVSFATRVDDVLRARSWTSTDQGSEVVRLGKMILVFGMINGAIMGSFGGLGGGSWQQVIYSAIKVPLLLGLTFVLCLPSFFVINSLLGLRSDFGRVVRSLMATQAGISIVLSALAPWTLLWYLSDGNYSRAVAFNAMVFGVSSFVGQLLLRRHYRPLIHKQPRHRPMITVWLMLYAGVGIQMGWVLRPFVGSPQLESQFFRQDAWSNAYVEIGELILRVWSGS